MPKKSHIYWYFQIIGWSLYIILNSVYLGLTYSSSSKDYLFYFLLLIAAIGISHLYRSVVIRFRILEFKIPLQLLCITFFSLVKGFLFFIVILGLSKVMGLSNENPTLIDVTVDVTNFAGIFFIWNTIYFGFHYFQNYKREEINSLRYLAASRESELKSLRAQLNPHFIFNCMNSIRALVDENPEKAKTAVTQLSNILRNSLLMDKSKDIELRDEMSLVKDFLDLEKIRYEERLCYEFKIEETVLTSRIPPFIIQSQVENAIKHGISKLPKGGKVLVEAAMVHNELLIKVTNTGQLHHGKAITGVGFVNSRQRLELLYGKKATISIVEQEDTVCVEIHIPIN